MVFGSVHVGTITILLSIVMETASFFGSCLTFLPFSENMLLPDIAKFLF